MKNLSLALVATLILFFCASTVQAQNQSDQNSNVITIHQTYPFSEVWECQEYGKISITLEVHQIWKTLPNGTFMYHLNAYGEGTDENGGEWTAHHIWSGKYGTLNNRTLILQGPKGAKLRLRVLFVRNGQGEIVQMKQDPLCE